MRFEVPQFIETETKIIGPLTLKQFLWIGGGTAIIFFLFLTFSGYILFLLAIPVAAVSGALAFIKIDEVPLINYIAYGLSYMLNSKKYIYEQETKTTFPELPTETSNP